MTNTQDVDMQEILRKLQLGKYNLPGCYFCAIYLVAHFLILVRFLFLMQIAHASAVLIIIINNTLHCINWFLSGSNILIKKIKNVYILALMPICIAIRSFANFPTVIKLIMQITN